jgi:hypothetical protein
MSAGAVVVRFWPAEYVGKAGSHPPPPHPRRNPMGGTVNTAATAAAGLGGGGEIGAIKAT